MAVLKTDFANVLAVSAGGHYEGGMELLTDSQLGGGLREVDNDYKRVGAVANAISILRSLAQHSRPIGVASVAREAGISVSTCFNILRTLTHERVISFDPEAKTYEISAGILELSLPILGANQADIIRPELGRVAETHKTLICLWHFVKGYRIVLVNKVTAPRIVHVEIPPGARLPSLGGAVGRCYAAHLNLDNQSLRSEFERIRWHSPPSFEQYLNEVEMARHDGFAFDSGELFGGLDIAAALVVDNAGNARFGISGIAIVGTKSKHEMQSLAGDLRDTADWISEILFGVPSGTMRNQRKASRLASAAGARAANGPVARHRG